VRVGWVGVNGLVFTPRVEVACPRSQSEGRLLSLHGGQA
jgi:hypothetical protein